MFKNLKKFLFIAIFSMLAIVWADSCPDICINEASYIDNIEQLSYDIFSITRIIDKTNKYGKGIPSDIKYLIQDLEKKGGNLIGCFGFYSNTLFLNTSNVVFGIFTLLKSPRSVLRDYVRLWDLADLVRNVYFTICKKGDINESLIPDQKNQLKAAIETYNSSYPLIKIQIKNGNLDNIKYEDVYEFLYYLISLHKDGLLKMMKAKDVNDVVNFLKGIYQNTCGKGPKPGFCEYFGIEPNEGLIAQLISDYQNCATCKVNFWDKVKKLAETFNRNISKDWQRITKAYDRLKDTLVNLGGGLTDYEAKKASEYWGRNFEPGTGSINPFGYKRLQVNIDKDLKKQWKEFVAPFTGMKAVGRAFRSQTFGVKNLGSGYRFEEYAEKMLKDEFTKTIAGTIDIMLAQASQVKIKEIKSDPTPITRIVPDITFRIKQAMYLLGRKDIEGSIVWYLGQACQMQCSNVGGICWYY